MAENSKSQTWLDQLDSVKLVENEKVKDQFVETYAKIHKVPLEDGEVIYNKEAIYFKQAVGASDKLRSCTRISLYSAFLEIAIQGLSIQPGAKSQAYLEARGIKVGDGYINTCFLRITAYGELDLRIMSGQILRMLNPIVVYEGDQFQPRTNPQGEIYVEYSAAIPRKTKKIIGCWVRIVLPGNLSDFKWLLEDDIARLKKYSIPRYGDNRNANVLYASENGGIDPGFLEAKTIKHAMRAYTKLRVGDNVAFEEEDAEEQVADKTSFAAPTSEPKEEAKPIVTNPDEPF